MASCKKSRIPGVLLLEEGGCRFLLPLNLLSLKRFCLLVFFGTFFFHFADLIVILVGRFLDECMAWRQLNPIFFVDYFGGGVDDRRITHGKAFVIDLVELFLVWDG